MIKQNNTCNMNMKVGKAVYDVTVHFSNSSKETMTDKIMRLIRNTDMIKR